MLLRVLPLLAGAAVLAGCSSGAQGTPSTPQSTSPASTPAKPIKSAVSTAITPVKRATLVATVNTDGGTTVAAAANPIKLGQAYLRDGNYKGAEQAFRQAIAAGKNATVAWAGLGTAASALNDYKTSLSAFRKALRAEPQSPAYLYGAARAALYTANYVASVTYASSLIKLKPRSVVAYHLRMLAWGRLLKGGKQLDDARKIAKLEPNDPQANNDLGIAYANTKHYAQSVATFGRAIHLQPKNYALYQNRAIVENLMKNRAAARSDIRRAIALAPDRATKKLLTEELNRLKNQA